MTISLNANTIPINPLTSEFRCDTFRGSNIAYTIRLDIKEKSPLSRRAFFEAARNANSRKMVARVSKWFDNLPVVGALPPEQAANVLRDVGEQETAEALDAAQSGSSQVFGIEDFLGWWPFQDKPWVHTGHAFGYLPTLSTPAYAPIPIRSVSSVPADLTLQNARITISLSRLRVAAYPGGGTHRVLLHFNAQNQTAGKREEVHFNATYRVHEGEHAGIQGYPIFVGLNVSGQGISLRCRTINVSNDQDEAFLHFLESDVFKAGLKLTTTLQPAVAPFSEMAYGLAEAIAARHHNVSVQDFDLGLDFSSIVMGARLAEGSYLAVQVPEDRQALWDWNDWVYHPSIGQVVSCSDSKQFIPYNYLVFSIVRYKEM